MWHEFSDQSETYEIYTQFMVGSSILFAPKVTKPSPILSSLQMQEVNFYLPTNEIWYNYQTKVQEPLTGVWQTRVLTDLEQGLFVLGGTTLSILQHESCMALLACIENSLTLEIYVNADGKSYGDLYLDDGETYDYSKDNGKASIYFNFDGGTLYSSFDYGDQYELPESQQVTKVIIYGVESAPMLVLAANLEADFWYDTARKAIVTSGFSMKLG
jgi:alpha-glucosidase (family GH31 glycosyl hydrolase)